MVPVMNVIHSSVECFLSDYYAGDWIDQLDELKTNIDERQVIANAGAYALGRKTDDLIVAAFAAGAVEPADRRRQYRHDAEQGHECVPDAGRGGSAG